MIRPSNVFIYISIFVHRTTPVNSINNNYYMDSAGIVQLECCRIVLLNNFYFIVAQSAINCFPVFVIVIIYLGGSNNITWCASLIYAHGQRYYNNNYNYYIKIYRIILSKVKDEQHTNMKQYLHRPCRQNIYSIFILQHLLIYRKRIIYTVGINYIILYYYIHYFGNENLTHPRVIL